MSWSRVGLGRRAPAPPRKLLYRSPSPPRRAGPTSGQTSDLILVPVGAPLVLGEADYSGAAVRARPTIGVVRKRPFSDDVDTGSSAEMQLSPIAASGRGPVGRLRLSVPAASVAA